jgi:aldehyde:ferredoxin oxidoreductase
MGTMAVRNYREGTYVDIGQIAAAASLRKAWIRNFACYCCPLACKKSGVTSSNSPYSCLVHDGPEYETGTMLGANLMISNFEGMLKAIYDSDDYGLDMISLGNVIGFLMEAYEQGMIDQTFLDDIDLTWGNVDATLQMIDKIANRDGVGDLAASGVKALSARIGQGSEKFAIHVKGHELAAWNVQAQPERGVCYATANRGACHLNGNNQQEQDGIAMMDSTGVCVFTIFNEGRYAMELVPQLLGTITGIARTPEEYMAVGERVFNLEKLFNLREGFTRADDVLPDRFFDDALTVGPKAGAVLDREQFAQMMEDYYTQRGWDPKTSVPTEAKLKSLGLPV